MIVAGALIALALLGRNTQVSVWSLLAAGIIAMVTRGPPPVEGWTWSQRSWQAGYTRRSRGDRGCGGLAIVIAAGALAATADLVLTFGLG